eukprot:TRINITY_DN1155_c0_g1_i14.p1 TRINITY_DN1155_c0_g1~~TRINITY_DN1155_c0_g1_i14.p1  ORF type:complete len:407 (-),score=108.94 TRINITY_DN1155_c0_g1_i14:494-1714(-)
MLRSLVGSEMCIRDRLRERVQLAVGSASLVALMTQAGAMLETHQSEFPKRLFLLSSFTNFDPPPPASNLSAAADPENDWEDVPDDHHVSAADVELARALSSSVGDNSEALVRAMLKIAKIRKQSSKALSRQEALRNASNTSLADAMRRLGHKGIPTTCITIGYDSQSAQVAAAVQGAPACNYLSAAPDESFWQDFSRSFECLVVAAVTNVRVEVQSGPFSVAGMIGQTQTEPLDSMNCEVLRFPTLFPSPSNRQQEVLGGVVLLALVPKPPYTMAHLEQPIKIVLRFDSAGETYTTGYNYQFPLLPDPPVGGTGQTDATVPIPWTSQSWSCTGSRKACLLHAYAQQVRVAVLNREAHSEKEVRRFVQHYRKSAAELDDEGLLMELELWEKVMHIKRQTKTSSCVVC